MYPFSKQSRTKERMIEFFEQKGMDFAKAKAKRISVGERFPRDYTLFLIWFDRHHTEELAKELTAYIRE